MRGNDLCVSNFTTHYTSLSKQFSVAAVISLFLCHRSTHFCLLFSVLPSEKLMSPSRCSSLMEANTSTTMPTVCSPSVSQMAFSIAPPSAHSAPPCPDPKPEPEPASSPSGPPPPGPALPPGPVLQFPCTHSSATRAQMHGPGAFWHPPTVRSLPKSSLGEATMG